MDDGVYDYAYMHLMSRQPVEVNEDYSSSAFNSTAENILTQVEVIDEYANPVGNYHTEAIASDESYSLQMEDIKDYSSKAYDSFDESPVNTRNNSTQVEVLEDYSTPGNYSVNTDNFSAQDLELFMDSLEDITRLKKAKYEKRQKLKERSFEASFEYSKKIITCLDTSLVITTADEDRKINFNSSSITDYNDDDVYYSVPYQSQTSALFNNSNMDSLKSISFMTSEESGVFFNNTVCQENLYENIDSIRPKKKSKSLKTRLISLMMRKHHAKPKTSAPNLLSHTQISEQLEENASHENMFNDVMSQESIKKRAAKKEKKKYRNSKKNKQLVDGEEKLINKAMRFLTL